MAIAVSCPSCGNSVQVSDPTTTRGECDACGSRFALVRMSEKVCCVCGKDTSQTARTADAGGNYYCIPCYLAREESQKAEPPAPITGGIACSSCGGVFDIDRIHGLGGMPLCEPCYSRQAEEKRQARAAAAAGCASCGQSLQADDGIEFEGRTVCYQCYCQQTQAAEEEKSEYRCGVCQGVFAATDGYDVGGVFTCRGCYSASSPEPSPASDLVVVDSLNDMAVTQTEPGSPIRKRRTESFWSGAMGFVVLLACAVGILFAAYMVLLKKPEPPTNGNTNPVLVLRDKADMLFAQGKYREAAKAYSEMLGLAGSGSDMEGAVAAARISLKAAEVKIAEMDSRESSRLFVDKPNRRSNRSPTVKDPTFIQPDSPTPDNQQAPKPESEGAKPENVPAVAEPQTTGEQRTPPKQTTVAMAEPSGNDLSKPAAGRIAAVDLLNLANLDSDPIAGNWISAGREISCDASETGVLEFPYEPPEEYDFRVVFSRNTGADELVQICSVAGRQFYWKIGSEGNTIAAFGADGAAAEEKPGWLENRRRYVSVVKVRKDRVEAYLDQQLVLQWKADYRKVELDPDWKLRGGNTLGLGLRSSNFIFHRVEVIEVTGHGRRLDQAQPKPH